MNESGTLKGNAAVVFEDTPQIPVVEGEPIYFLNTAARDPYAFEFHDDEILDFTKLEEMRNLFSGCGSEASKSKPLVLPEGFGQNATTLESCFDVWDANTRAGSSFGITSITLPDGFGQKATTLKKCFYGAKILKTLTIGEGFGQNATDFSYCFYRCLALEELVLPQGCGQNAETLHSCFMVSNSASGEANLKKLVLPEGFGQKATDLYACFAFCPFDTIDLPEGFGQNATTLYWCFCGCDSMTSLSLPKGFGQKAGSLLGAFSGQKLQSLVLPDDCGRVASELQAMCFECYELTDIYLPEGFGIKSKNNGAIFSKCLKLTNITGNPNFITSLKLDASPLLTVDSLMVIINGLQTVTTTQTLTLGETNRAKLTEDQIKVATDKGWTVE